MTKRKVKRFLRRNYIKIPFYTLAIVLFFAVAHWVEGPHYQTPGVRVPVMVVHAEDLVAPEEYPEIEDPGCLGSVEEMITAACAYHGIEVDMPLAIAMFETGHFTSAAYTELNNVGGLSVDEQPIRYDTLMDGVDAFVANLADNYFGKGLTTVEEVGAKYCPVNEENWIAGVRAIMEEER